eukprot:m.169275 g.169275  ORF g.169275 m.169275 type:complete len:203 (+) comp38980_c0_seq6:635-1243(+)
MFKSQRECMSSHLQDSMHQHMRLLLTQQRETREELVSFKTRYQIENHHKEFLWAIEDWPAIERKAGKQTILSRKCKLKEDLCLRFQMAIQRDDNLFSARIYVHNVVGSSFPTNLIFKVSVFSRSPFGESTRKVDLKRNKLLLVHYYREKQGIHITSKEKVVKIDQFHLHDGSTLLIRFGWREMSQLDIITGIMTKQLRTGIL